MLVIGNAGGTIGRAYGRFYPGRRIDGVELDPKVKRWPAATSAPETTRACG
jgi:hypothetical protein